MIAIKPLFSFGPTLTTKLVVLAIISIGLMTVDHRFNALDPVRSTLSLLVYPVQYGVNLPVKLAQWASKNLASRQRLIEENRRLRSQHLRLNAKLQQLTSLEQENTRLRELLTSASRFKEKRMLIAELLAVALDPYQQKIIINKGQIDGVYSGQPLLDAHGIVGQITHVTPFSATAILISDPSHALPVRIVRNGLRSLLVGTGKANALSLHHIPSSSDIIVGDVVSTSGLGGRFPPDYPVAKIIHIERPPGEPFAVVTATPLAHLDRSPEVLLVWPEKPSIKAFVAKSHP